MGEHRESKLEFSSRGIFGVLSMDLKLHHIPQSTLDINTKSPADEKLLSGPLREQLNQVPTHLEVHGSLGSKVCLVSC